MDQLMEIIQKRMKELNLTKTSLAKKIGLTRGRVSQILSKPGNMTIKSLARIAGAVDMKVHVNLSKVDGEGS